MSGEDTSEEGFEGFGTLWAKREEDKARYFRRQNNSGEQVEDPWVNRSARIDKRRLREERAGLHYFVHDGNYEIVGSVDKTITSKKPDSSDDYNHGSNPVLTPDQAFGILVHMGFDSDEMVEKVYGITIEPLDVALRVEEERLHGRTQPLVPDNQRDLKTILYHGLGR